MTNPDMATGRGALGQYAVLSALGSDYLSLSLVNVKTGTAIALKNSRGMIPPEEYAAQPEVSYKDACEQTIRYLVAEPYRAPLSQAVALPNVLHELADKPEYSLRFDAVMHGETHDMQMKYLHVYDSDFILMGCRVVDTIYTQEKLRGDRLEKAAADAVQAAADADERTLQERARGDRLEKAVADAAALTKLDKAAIRSGAQTLRKERMFLDVLCRDYTSVYYYDVDSDAMEVLKMVNTATAEPTAAPRRTVSFTDRFRMYAARYVQEADRADFLQTFNRENIIHELSKAPRFLYRYRVDATLDGHRNYEALVVRVNPDAFDGAVLLAFHPIDELVAAEVKHQRELEDTLQKERESNEVLKSISWIYYGVFRVDLPSDTYQTLSCTSDVLRAIAGSAGRASTTLQTFCRKFMAEEYQPTLLRFFDIATLADRLQNVDTVAADFQANDGNWHTGRFIVKRRDADGRAVQVLYAASRFTEEQWREKNSISLAKEAERASQAKTDFLRRMSHDIRTPINGIIGLLHMEERFADNPAKQRECRDKILMSTDYLLSLVNNVLDIGKVESGELILENKPFHLIPLLMNQLAIVETQTHDRGITFRGGKDMSVIRHPFLIGSEVYLNRLLMNIANNAIKYTKRGGSVTFYCTETAYDGEHVTYEFVCADTGIGMSEEFQKHAFDAFSQENKVNDTTYNGSGLGLSIVKKIVDQMGGAIELKSKEDVGTTFKITLTFQVDHSAHSTADGLYEVPVDVDVTGKRALLVDDNALNREIADMVLGDLGLEITTATDGEDAVAQFEASAPGYYDFIFMDVVMPRMNGLDATRAIRKLDRPDAATVPILAMTANAFQDDIQQSTAAGMNAHLTKPLDVDKIKKALYTVMKK